MFRAWKSFRKHFLSDIYYMFTPSLTQAYYIGYIGHGNVGDEAIYYATKKLFARRIKFHSAEVSNSIIEKILFADFKSIFLGGGTLIKGPSIQFKRIKSILYKYNSIPFIIFGTGVGDADMWERLGFKTDKAAWREIVDRSTYLGVRGPLSKQFLYEWGVSKEAHVIGDPALLLADNELKPKPKKRGKHIGINLGYTLWDKKLVRKQTQRTLEFGMRLLKYCSEEGWSITLFAMCPEDEDFLSKTLSLAGVPIFSFIKPDTNLLHIIQILGEQDVFIGMKLHSVVLAS
jgi:polysaccharide pyruvyl transferase WcaK-like protein